MANSYRSKWSQQNKNKNSPSADSKTKTQEGYLKRAHFFSKTRLAVFGIVFALVGGYFLWQTFAATSCLVSNRSSWALGGADCNVGTTIIRTNQAFTCNQPLSNYGTLPLKVTIQSTAAWSSAGAVLLDGGCSGDGNLDTIDLIVDIRGDGPKSSVGPGEDALKTRTSPGPQNIQLTGVINCGRQAPGAHQDGVQIQGGSNITFVNIMMGNYRNGLSTCQGAGGAFFYSINNPNNVDILGGEFIACNHGLLGDIGSNHDVIDAKFRSGRNDGTDPQCDYVSGGACTQYANLNMSNVTCGEWDANTDSWDDIVVNPTSLPPPPPSTPPLAPALSLSANPPAVSSGGSSTLSWSSTRASSCRASGGWSGSKSTSGSQSTGPLTATTDFSLTCTGSGGSANATTRVTVVSNSVPPSPSSPPPPRVQPWVKKGDLNNDGLVNIFDLSILLRYYRTDKVEADVNDDGRVDVFDLSALLSKYGRNV